MVADVNHDGVLDVLDVEGGALLLGSYPKPGTLLEIDNLHDGRTTLTYAPSSDMAPAGDPAELQRNHLQLDLVTEVHTEDTLQGDVSRTTHVYADGEVRGGKFLGFETQETTSWEPRLVFDPATRTMPPAVDTEGDTWWYLRARTTTTHDLTRVGAQATSVAIDTDHALAVLSLSAHNGVQPDVDRRFTTTTSYEDVSGDGDGTCADQLGHLPRCLPVRREVTTHREQLQSMPGQPADATTVVELGYSPEGLIETVDEIDDSGVTPAMQTAITWTWDADHRHAVPMTKQLFGSHAMVGPQALLEEVRWSYGAPWGDYGDGLMSVQEVCSDEVGAATPCTESILWTFSRNARGVVDDVSAPDGGSQIIDDFAFGGAIPTTTRNALDHVTVHEADDLGRVTVTTDPNGVQTRTTFDPFGRPLVEAMTGVGGIERLTQQRTYFDGVPRRVTTQRFDGSDVVTSASKQSFDGFGHPFQSVDKVDVDTWISTEAFTDAFGRQRFTTEPETLALAGNLPIGGALTATEYDALGTARLHWSDLVGAPACFSATWEPGPRMTVQTDESGRNTGLRRDAFGRLVEVTEFHDGITHSVDCSESGTFRIPTRVVASYDWSGRGELQILSDPSTNGLRDRWWYDFDMAGRLQRTFRSADGDPVPNPANASIYSSYRFDEGRPDAMFWGTTTAPNSAVEWDYDPLGRVVAKRVRRDADGNDPTTWPEWQTTWDTHGGRSWLGMKLQERSYVVPGVGPSALTEWFYDGATVGDVGNLGRPSSVTRSFATDQTVATFAHEVDLYGDPVRTVFPSGAAVRTVRNDHGRVQQLEVGMPDGTSLKLDMTYDDYGIGSGFSSPGVHGQHIDRTSPTRLETVRWDAGTDAYGVRYAYGGDLRLLSRHYEHDLATLLPANALVYSYDWAGRVHTISWGGSVAESYSYDVIGNLHSVELGGEVWTYGAPGLFNAPTQRTSDAGILETATVDPATGRLLQVLRQDPGPLGGATHYSYDGTGKLHESWTAPTGGGSDGIRYVHDQDDVLIEKLHVEGNGNYTGSELYLDSWQLEYDHATGDTVAIESLTPAVRVRTVTPAGGTATSTREWLLREPDGHVLARFDDAGTLLSAEVVGLYGSPVHTVGTHPEEDGVHGMEGDHELGLVAMGVRHMAMRDGQWLQPEPLLHLGPPSDMLSNPRALFGPYAAGMGVTRHDRSGYAIETGWDAANVAMGVVSLGANVAAGNWFDAGVDAVGLVVDVAATAVPGVPGGAGTAIRAARTADKVVDAVSTSKTLARAGDKAGDVAKTGCFVAGTPVRTVDGDAAIEDIEVGDRVLAAVPDAMSQSPTDLDDTGSWLTRACDRVLRRARVAALPAFLMTACDVAEPPTAEASVEIYDARTGDWIDGEVRDGRVGTELRHDGHLFRITERGLLDLGAVDDSLDEADATYTGTEATRAPRADDWVLVLTRDDVAHDRLRRVTPGTRVAFQGRIFETLGNARVSQLLETDDVIGRVYQTHVREADGVFDLDIGYPDGSFGTVTGTHEHPFWVPSLQGWVALEDLRVGMVLQTSGGDEATVLGLSFRSGDTDVFNFEVEGAHDYFVFDRSGNHCVLVHNGCGPELPDDALVCRGGTCTADRFTGGSGVSTGPDGALDGVSTQSAPGASVEELAGAFQNNQVGVTTAGKIREAGGKVVADGTPRNPNHATVSGITAEQAEELFEVMPNPVPKGERGK
jgi:YD repeat-containing protein